MQTERTALDFITWKTAWNVYYLVHVIFEFRLDKTFKYTTPLFLEILIFVIIDLQQEP